MSECVVRMETPTKDKACGMVFDFDGIWYCPVEQRICHQPDYRDIPSWCPIICQLPEGHWRLVDAYAFEKDVSDALVYGLKEIPSEEGKQIFHVLMQEVLDNVKKRKTIVPAEAERSE